ncbi:MAG: hypothetical protein NXI32_31480, partial [bacterium]|nr:hypothetical protein [bacterium]
QGGSGVDAYRLMEDVPIIPGASTLDPGGMSFDGALFGENPMVGAFSNEAIRPAKREWWVQ